MTEGVGGNFGLAYMREQGDEAIDFGGDQLDKWKAKLTTGLDGEAGLGFDATLIDALLEIIELEGLNYEQAATLLERYLDANGDNVISNSDKTALDDAEDANNDGYVTADETDAGGANIEVRLGGEDSAVEDSAVEDSAVEEPAVEEPAVEEPAEEMSEAGAVDPVFREDPLGGLETIMDGDVTNLATAKASTKAAIEVILAGDTTGTLDKINTFIDAGTTDLSILTAFLDNMAALGKGTGEHSIDERKGENLTGRDFYQLIQNPNFEITADGEINFPDGDIAAFDKDDSGYQTWKEGWKPRDKGENDATPAAS